MNTKWFLLLLAASIANDSHLAVGAVIEDDTYFIGPTLSSSRQGFILTPPNHLEPVTFGDGIRDVAAGTFRIRNTTLISSLLVSEDIIYSANGSVDITIQVGFFSFFTTNPNLDLFPDIYTDPVNGEPLQDPGFFLGAGVPGFDGLDFDRPAFLTSAQFWAVDERGDITIPQSNILPLLQSDFSNPDGSWTGDAGVVFRNIDVVGMGTQAFFLSFTIAAPEPSSMQVLMPFVCAVLCRRQGLFNSEN